MLRHAGFFTLGLHSLRPSCQHAQQQTVQRRQSSHSCLWHVLHTISSHHVPKTPVFQGVFALLASLHTDEVCLTSITRDSVTSNTAVCLSDFSVCTVASGPCLHAVARSSTASRVSESSCWLAGVHAHNTPSKARSCVLVPVVFVDLLLLLGPMSNIAYKKITPS